MRLHGFAMRSGHKNIKIVLRKRQKCCLLTNSEEAELDAEGVPITVLPVGKWLFKLY